MSFSPPKPIVKSPDPIVKSPSQQKKFRADKPTATAAHGPDRGAATAIHMYAHCAALHTLCVYNNNGCPSDSAEGNLNPLIPTARFDAVVPDEDLFSLAQ